MSSEHSKSTHASPADAQPVELVVRDRRGTNSMKWDALKSKFSSDELLPLWVADMDFQSPACVGEALKKAAEFNLYGYYVPSPSYKQSFIDWEQKYHGLEVNQEWIKFAPGIVTAIFWLVQTMTEPGDACIVLSPSYYPFMEAVEHTGRELVCSYLTNENGIYHIDFDDFERQIAERQVKLFILCSPHNPVSRVWRAEELERLLAICRKHNVLVISDEIHHDFVASGFTHIPTLDYLEYRDMVIMVTAPSKTFNMAACKNSFVVIPNPALRDKYTAFCRAYRLNGGSMFGYIAAEAAYTGGRPWLEAVWAQIQENYRYIKEQLETAFPKIVVTPLEATYLMWIDMGAYLTSDELIPFIEEQCRLALDFGKWFNDASRPDDTHIRVNLATSHENVETMVNNLSTALKRKLGN